MPASRCLFVAFFVCDANIAATAVVTAVVTVVVAICCMTWSIARIVCIYRRCSHTLCIGLLEFSIDLHTHDILTGGTVTLHARQSVSFYEYLKGATICFATRLSAVCILLPFFFQRIDLKFCSWIIYLVAVVSCVVMSHNLWPTSIFDFTSFNAIHIIDLMNK